MKRALYTGLFAFLFTTNLASSQESNSQPLAPGTRLPSLPAAGAAHPVDVVNSSPISNCFAPCTDCCRGYKTWGGVEFLNWWTKDAPVPAPLITQDLANGVDPTGGQIGSPNTAVLLGNRDYDTGTRFGARITAGAWLNSCKTIGIEASYFFIAPNSTNASTSTDGTPGSPNIGAPFIDATTGNEAFLFGGGGAIPGVVIPADANLRIGNRLQGAEFNFIGRLGSREAWTITGLAGFRYLNFHEDLTFSVGGSVPALGVNIARQDNFGAANNFYGGQIGIRGEYQMGRFFVMGGAKVALGSMNQVVTINGETNLSDPNGAAGGTVLAASGGIFAQSTNIGSYSRNVFAVVPECEFKLGYNITRSLSATVGYNFLFVSDVARPGTAIDRNLNFTQAPPGGILVGTPAPTFSFSNSDFWAQGVSVGLQFKY